MKRVRKHGSSACFGEKALTVLISFHRQWIPVWSSQVSSRKTKDVSLNHETHRDTYLNDFGKSYLEQLMIDLSQKVFKSSSSRKPTVSAPRLRKSNQQLLENRDSLNKWRNLKKLSFRLFLDNKPNIRETIDFTHITSAVVMNSEIKRHQTHLKHETVCPVEFMNGFTSSRTTRRLRHLSSSTASASGKEHSRMSSQRKHTHTHKHWGIPHKGRYLFIWKGTVYHFFNMNVSISCIAMDLAEGWFSSAVTGGSSHDKIIHFQNTIKYSYAHILSVLVYLHSDPDLLRWVSVSHVDDVKFLVDQ